jgi:threonine dehydrogenase-like Zn-dependent dehydrogenase
LSDILPTAWQAVSYADLPPDGTLLVVGLGPVGQLCVTSAFRQGAARVIGVDLVPERLERAASLGAIALDGADADLTTRVLELTDGRGVDSAIDAVGMEAHGSPLAAAATSVVARLPRRIAATISRKAGIDRLAAFETATSLLRRGGTLSVVGVYGGATDPINLRQLFDRQVTIRMGQANVRRWTDPLLDVLRLDEDVFGVDTLASHHLPLAEAPQAYRLFHGRQDGCIKVVLRP